MKIPTLQQAKALIEEAGKLNPGKWIDHSIHAARAAQRIARQHPALDPETAYILGLLHDIGRRKGIMQMRHSVEGYKFLMDQGFVDAARICLTHSFPYKEIHVICGKWDCTDEDIVLIQSYIDGIEYNEYDRLIQLCDVLALPTGFCLMEKRFVDVALRYGTSNYTILKWKAFFEIKNGLEKEIGRSVYSVLPGIIENTFELDVEEFTKEVLDDEGLN